MSEIITIGLDIAKSVFQVHGVDGEGAVVVRQLRRSEVAKFFTKLPPYMIGLEACASAHLRNYRFLYHPSTNPMPLQTQVLRTSKGAAIPG
jgi:hypothetical protein